MKINFEVNDEIIKLVVSSSIRQTLGVTEDRLLVAAGLGSIETLANTLLNTNQIARDLKAYLEESLRQALEDDLADDEEGDSVESQREIVEEAWSRVNWSTQSNIWKGRLAETKVELARKEQLLASSAYDRQRDREDHLERFFAYKSVFGNTILHPRDVDLCVEAVEDRLNDLLKQNGGEEPATVKVKTRRRS